jgi:hypothetical protein
LSRESALKATAAGLQAKSLDLTRYAKARVASREREFRVPTDIAAYALGFSVADVEIDGERIRGAPLAAVLLRLKYAEQVTVANFTRAHLLLVDQYGGLNGPSKAPDILSAVARAALIEWLRDECPQCRGAERGQVKPRRCTACLHSKPVVYEGGERRLTVRVETEPYKDPWGQVYLDREGAVIERREATTSPLAGCPKCAGLGRIFSKPKESRGVRCVNCSNSGRLHYRHKRRFRLVNTFVVAHQRAHGAPPVGLKLKNFSARWCSRYDRFIEVLRAIDRQMGSAIDFNFEAGPRRDERLGVRGVDSEGNFAENAAIEPDQEEKQDEASAERSVLQSMSPQEPTGGLPPQES